MKLMTIAQFNVNIMGTISFLGKAEGWRKDQDFICYPMPDQSSEVKIQSEKRSARIDLNHGAVRMYSNKYFLGKDEFFVLCEEDLKILKSWINHSGGVTVGGYVKSDNTGALTVNVAI